jgi:hypothetical protein
MYDVTRARRLAHETHAEALRATETAIMMLALCDTFALPYGHPKRVRAALAYDHAAAAELAANVAWQRARYRDDIGSFVL